MRMMQWLVKLLFSVLITSVVCVVCTFVVMTTYVDMILDQYQLKSSAFTTPSWSQFVAHVEKQASGFRLFSNTVHPTAENRPVSAKPVTPNNKEVDGRSSTGGGAMNQQQQQNTTRESPPDDAVAVFGQQSSTPKKTDTQSDSNRSTIKGESVDSGTGPIVNSGGGAASVPNVPNVPNSKNTEGTDTSGRVVVSGEEFAKKKELLSSDDRNKIFKLLMTRVPQSEIQKISQLMEDGITASELKDIEQLLQSYLKPEEYSQLLSMIKSE
jgi:hypothetical protein